MPSTTFNISFDVTAFEKLAKRLSRGPKRVEEYVNSQIKTLTLGMTRNLIAVTPRKSSELAQSSKAIQEGQAKWRIVQTATARNRSRSGYLYGLGLRLGTRRHIILPRLGIKKALWWPGIKGGRPVPMVNHPGQRPKKYHEDALSRSRQLIKETGRNIATKGAVRYIGRSS